MPNARDEEFIRFAVASGYLTEEQGQQAVQALAEIEALGGAASAPEMLLKRGLLDEHQAGLVHQAVAASKSATRVPRELGGFELLEKIGQGGMGSVFKARQKDLDRLVAVKILAPRLARSEEFVARFFREARAAGRLNHPNIVAAIDVGESEGFYYLAMEFVDGETLSRLVARQGPLPEGRALGIAADVARALDHAARTGLIHRDIKPDNIMLTSDGQVRVTDFGLAKALGGGTPEGTDAERFLGTPAYVAPEQIRSEPDIDCRADIFSLGVTLFQMLTGEAPFKGANPMAIAAAVASEPLPSIRKIRGDISLATARVLEKMTAKDRAQRFATPGEVAAALEAARAAPPLPRIPPDHSPARGARRVAARRRRSRTGTWIGILLGISAHVALFLYLYPKLRDGWRRSDEPPPRQVTVLAPEAQKTPAAEAVSKAPSKAELEQARLAEQRERAASEELTARAAKADELVRAGKIDEGLAILDTFPNELRTRAATARLERLRAESRARALAAFDGIDASAKKLVAQQKLAEARAIYVDFQRCGVPEIASRATQALAAIDAEIARGQSEAVRAAHAAYRRAAQAILDRLAARDYEQARALSVTASVRPELRPVRDQVQGLQDLVRIATEVRTSAGLGAKTLKPGQPFRLGDLAGEVAEADEERISLKVGAGVAARRLAELKTAELADLALRSYGEATPQTNAKLALFLLAERAYAAAHTRLEAARAAGGDVAHELDLLARLAPRTCPRCKGGKTIPCPDCGGKGYSKMERHDCEVCSGRGGGRCGYCRGTGKGPCTNCNGTGRTTGGTVCGVCGGTGRGTCTHCGGDGYLKCKACKAKGFIVKTTACPACKGEKSVACPDCGGTGVLPPPDLAPPGRASAPKGAP